MSFTSLALSIAALFTAAEASDRTSATRSALVDPCALGTPLGTVLTWDVAVSQSGPTGPFLPIDDGDSIGSYGSFVDAPLQQSGSRRNSYCGGDTPHILRWGAVEPDLTYWEDRYDDLVGVAYVDRIFDELAVSFSPQTADHRAVLYGFDLGGWDNGATQGLDPTTIPKVAVLVGEATANSGAPFNPSRFVEVDAVTNLTVGTGKHVSFVFDPPIVSPDPMSLADFSTVRIVLDLGGVMTSDYVGIDNIHIAETGIARFESAQYEVSEGDDEVVVVVERTAAAKVEIPASVDLALVDLSATLDEDYQLPSGASLGPVTVTWAAGDRAPKTVRFPILDDLDVEGDETFELRLTNPVGIGLGVSSTGPEVAVATVLIEDDDGSSIDIKGAGTTVVDQLETYVATASCQPTPTRWSWTTQGGTIVGPTDASQLRVRWSTEGLKTVVARALDGGCAGDSASLDVDVTGDLSLGFAQASFSAREGDGGLDLVLRRGGTASASVLLELLDGTARRGSDYTGPSSILVEWKNGDPVEQVVRIDLVDDAAREPTEQFRARLSGPLGGPLGQSTAEAVIFDDDVSLGPPDQVETGVAPVNPVVAYSPLGGKAVVWVESANCIDPQTGLSELCFKVQAQFFDAADRSVGLPFEVSRRATSLQDRPDATFSPDGRLFVVWPESSVGAKGAAAGDDLVGRFFNPNGTPAGSELDVAETSNGNIEGPDVEIDRNGEVVVSWEDSDEAKARFLDPDGAPRSGEIRPGASSTEERRPAVARNSSGATVIAFEGTGSREGIQARRYADDGTRLGQLVRVDRDPSAARADLVVADDGSFTVVYERTGGLGTDVVLARFDADGNRLGEERIVNPTDGTRHVEPRIATNAGGDLLVVWRSTLGAKGADGNIVGRFFNPSGEPVTEPIDVAETSGGTTPVEPDVSINDDDEATVVYEREGPSGLSEGIFRTILQPSLARDCVPGNEALCLQQSRFEIRADWQDFEGGTGAGRALPLTPDSGTFWFFSPDNVELIVKVLDACGVNGHYWLFAAGLTDVEVHLKADDTEVGSTRSYFHTSGEPFETIRDVSAFPCAAGRPASRAARLSDDEVERRAREFFAEAERQVADLRRVEASSSATCSTSSTELCVNGGRFRIEVDWATAQGTSGQGRATQLTGDSGTFWFFSPDNVELIFKVLDGCVFNQRYWVFGSGLTDVEVDVRITDTQTGAVQRFDNPLGRGFVPIRDINAFSGCP